ncbi:MAG: hypothetical protein ACREJM_11390, partial [Candidatus Saccharimonadales bacterium]
MINAIVEFLWADPGARVAIAVPTHALGAGLADRINGKFGSPVAMEWYGIDSQDPLTRASKMCRLAEAAMALQSAGGKLQLLCSSRSGGCCSHHPAVAGPNPCGYLRQQQAAIRNAVRVWIVPSVMLGSATPPALRRQGQNGSGDFDLLVIDEAPWFGLLGGTGEEPFGVPVEWLAPDWWQGQTPRAHLADRDLAIETLTRLHNVLTHHPPGEVSADRFKAVGLDPHAINRARRFAFRCKTDLRAVVRPGSVHSELDRALSAIAPANRRVLNVADALRVIRLRLQGRLAPSGLELAQSPDGKPFLRLRWRKDVDPGWLAAPVLYLDAAGTGGHRIAEAWLPDIELAIEARAAAPYMRLSQVIDSQVSYQKISSEATADRLARIVEARGPDGLVACPKTLRARWQAAKRLPGWELWNFQALRGRDEAKQVPS